MDFRINSPFKPTGDQPQAISELVKGLDRGDRHQTLLGVTGSGKTFTVANVIEKVQRPTLILSHNKTLAAQLYGEFKQFFPDNAVEYFVSYYDYYQPEAFIPTTNTYIEKDLAINDEIEKLRLSTTSTLLSGRKDIIVVSSVSCIYGLGNPADFLKGIIRISKGERISRNTFLHALVTALYSRTEGEFKRGTFRVKGDTVDLFLAYAERALRFTFFGDEIEEIESIEPATGKRIELLDHVAIFPATIFVTNAKQQLKAIWQIQEDMVKQVDYFKENGRNLEAKRLDDRVTHDLEMIRELGYCSGIENYSRYFDGREPGMRPFCLLDYFPEDYIMVIDESHVTIPQIRAMYGGDRSRKVNLVEYGFRLPAAMDNRPLKFEEFETLQQQVVYVSATPADYEMTKSEGVIVEQLIRPTGLLDPLIEVKPCGNQVDDLLEEIDVTVKKNERVLVTTLTKRMAEELAKYLTKLSIRCRYIHSEVETLDRVELLRDFRLGLYDVLIGINLLREGLDLPEVSLVAIMDADKEGFLRSNRSLTQTAGRAARNVNGRVIMYADKITESMRKTIDETNRRREKQMKYNMENDIVPTPLNKSREMILQQTVVSGTKNVNAYIESENVTVAADPVVQYMTEEQLGSAITKTKKQMEVAAKEMDFMEAARLRDEMFELQKLLKERFGK
ncbi:MAG: excinuclease ABC subunit UvrB [Bacteroidia bacterium]|nr:excinuclease ABC subunit UvrB [Bacteroidia bacterium]MBP7715458.1 excinuclease ABC subunit UvrB [Bacteroidia bacterium]MBP8667541.1 excinuclease ABC subunit UvrB [Bacteroidia bacterium]HQW18242.1 excinuclease ABC subunit UvrB [Bacteroidia bacterium]HQW49557.1 excinuclease ABC subunit UvrB [Bacteroidia bacterium]